MTSLHLPNMLPRVNLHVASLLLTQQLSYLTGISYKLASNAMTKSQGRNRRPMFHRALVYRNCSSSSTLVTKKQLHSGEELGKFNVCLQTYHSTLSFLLLLLRGHFSCNQLTHKKDTQATWKPFDNRRTPNAKVC